MKALYGDWLTCLFIKKCKYFRVSSYFWEKKFVEIILKIKK